MSQKRRVAVSEELDGGKKIVKWYQVTMSADSHG